MAIIRVSLVSLLNALFILEVLAARQCYWPNGSPADSGMVPCNPNDPQSACCPGSNNCLSNGLCRANNQWNWVWRNACTDKSFLDPACPKYCVSRNEANAALAFQCDYSGNEYCCNTGPTSELERATNTSCCNSPSLLFEAEIVPVSIRTDTTPSTLLTSLPSATSSVSLGFSFNFTTPASSSTSTSTSRPASISNPSSPASSARGVAIVAGVTVPIAILSLAALGFFLFRNRRKKAQALPEHYYEPNGYLGKETEPTHGTNGFHVRGTGQNAVISVVSHELPVTDSGRGRRGAIVP